LEVVHQRAEPAGQIIRGPVDHRPFGQVRQRRLEPGQPPIQHQARADQLIAVVEPAQRLRPPLTLHRRPGWGLQETHRRLGRVNRAVIARRDAPYPKSHSRSYLSLLGRSTSTSWGPDTSAAATSSRRAPREALTSTTSPTVSPPRSHSTAAALSA